MAKRNLVDDINSLGPCLFREYAVGKTTEMQFRCLVRGRLVIMRVESVADRDRLLLAPTWGVRVLRVDAATEKEVVATVSLITTPVSLVSTPRQGSHKRVAGGEVVDLGPAPKRRGLGQNVLPHVTKTMRQAAQAQSRLSSATPPARGGVVARSKKEKGKKG